MLPLHGSSQIQSAKWTSNQVSVGKEQLPERSSVAHQQFISTQSVQRNHHSVAAQFAIKCPDGQQQSRPNHFEVVGVLKKVLSQRAGFHSPISCNGARLLDGGLCIFQLIV